MANCHKLWRPRSAPGAQKTCGDRCWGCFCLVFTIFWWRWKKTRQTQMVLWTLMFVWFTASSLVMMILSAGPFSHFQRKEVADAPDQHSSELCLTMPLSPYASWRARRKRRRRRSIVLRLLKGYILKVLGRCFDDGCFFLIYPKNGWPGWVLEYW